MQELLDDILHDRRNDPATLPLRVMLRVFAYIFGVITFWRNFLYNRGVLKSHQVPCRVICIGNLTVGGTGKTPIVIMTAQLLHDQGINAAVVSRGYGRSGGKPIVVSDGTTIASPDIAGDEPHLIASRVPDVPVVVGKDRYRAAMLAYERFSPEVIILDDGFQHRRLYRDIDIVTMDADSPIGSEHFLPRGLLRESPYNLARANAVMVTRLSGTHDRERIERMIRYYNKSIPIFWSRTVADGLHDPISGSKDGLASLSGVPVAALSNVANPDSFYRLLKDDYAKIVYRQAMPDHHRYTNDEIMTIARDAKNAGASFVVMTAKDERNLPHGLSVEHMEMWVLDIDAVLVGDQNEFLELIVPQNRIQNTE